ncbi:MAG: transglutaminase domain-containing protein [Actinobacteria bacterium]|nr:transglutaminase domain-containing protein [Actinomycetota bacterium]
MTAPTDSTPRRSTRHPDRRDVQPWLLVALVVSAMVAAATAGLVVAARHGGSTLVGGLTGALVAALALVGLPSVSIRLVARLVVVATGALLVRFGVLAGSLLSDGQAVLAWVVAVVAVFVLTDRLSTDVEPPLRPVGLSPPPPTDADHADRVAPTGPGLADPGRTTRAVLGVLAVVALLGLLLTPLARPHAGRATASGDGPRIGSSQQATSSLASSDRLDMTQRPELTEEVMFTVEGGPRTFWRGETFDRWDGRTWTRSEPQRYAVAPDGTILPSVDDLGVNGDDEFTQRIRIEADFAEVLYAAPSPVVVDADRPLAQRFDGTVSTAGLAMGRGATYTVTSRRPLLSTDLLREAGRQPVPEGVRSRYATVPTATPRVLAAARRVTEGVTGTYDQIRALERWMGARTEYSLDAPLSPTGVDVVDHFLFESRQGWCEQIASSLVVLARANGIPARLVSGFVPDERDAVTGTFVVRARNAHAWAEVWFAGLGWVPFDPTADVPLAGDDDSGETIGEWLARHAVVLAIAAVVVGLAAWGARTLWRRLRRRSAERAHVREVWAAGLDAQLVALGERVGRPRAPGETATGYAAILADRYDEPSLAHVGVVIDDGLYAPDAPTPADREAAAALIVRLAATDPPPPANVRYGSDVLA